MQLDVDFEVFKALTVLRNDESDTYNEVIRRLLRLAHVEEKFGELHDRLTPADQSMAAALIYGNGAPKDGAWIGNVHFPNGTRFRASYKGRTYRAQIEKDVWLGEDGTVRQSPSEAARAICGTNVNGWRFWYGIRPNEDDWRRLDEFRA